MRPGFAVLLFVGQALSAFAPAGSLRAEDRGTTPDGWYSSGVGSERSRDVGNAERSVPLRRRSDGAMPGDERVPTPIVPYHSTLYGSSRNDFPSAPAAATHRYAAPAENWNVAMPPVVDLGRDFGVAAPAGTAPAEARPATSPAPATATPAAVNSYSIQTPVEPRPANVAPAVTEQTLKPSTPPVVIDAGTLVPVHLPQLEDKSTTKTDQATSDQSATSELHVPSRPAGSATESGGGLTHVRKSQAAVNLEPKPAQDGTAKKNPKVTKATEVGAKSQSTRPREAGRPSAKEPQASPRERREGFALPQPAIPLEGRLLRKLLGF
jgi:hypothetical protein